jgi:hypothetical protein
MTATKRNDGREADIVLVRRAMWTNVTMINAWIVMLQALAPVPTSNCRNIALSPVALPLKSLSVSDPALQAPGCAKTGCWLQESKSPTRRPSQGFADAPFLFSRALRLRLANAPEAARCIDEADDSMRQTGEESLALISSSFRIERRQFSPTKIGGSWQAF